jgi:uncharacterized protein
LESSSPSASSLKQFADARNIVLESFKKNGQAKGTVVWLTVDNGMVYVRTYPKSWKAKRIRKNPHVRIIPSDGRGKTSGTWADGNAHFVEGEEATRILKIIRKKYGFVGALVHLLNVLRGQGAVAVISIRLITPSSTPPN